MKQLLFLSLSVTLSSLLSGAAVSSAAAMLAAPLRVYAIPGQNGLGSSPAYVAQQLGMRKNQITAIGTPGWPVIDLGQSRCLAHLKGITEPGIVHATSQGTATAIRYAAENPGKVKALILEATLASGNSAIHHTACGSRDPRGSYYWLPYLAKLLFPLYSPSGTQPIHVVDKLSKDIPIIIAHDQNDAQLSYQDACALYYKLCASGNKNVYLIQPLPTHPHITWGGFAHIEVLHQQGELVQALLANHGIGQSKVPAIRMLSHFQPDPEQFKPAYDALIAKEKIHTKIGYGVNAALAAVALYGAFRVAKSAPAQQLRQRMQALLRRIPALASPMLVRA